MRQFVATDAFGNYIPGLNDDTGYVPPQNGDGVQIGTGAPNASTPLSIIYVDSATGNIYTNPTQVAGAWVAAGGSGGTAQLVTYTSGTPANPADITKPAYAYDPNGFLSPLGWNTTTHLWV